MNLLQEITDAQAEAGLDGDKHWHVWAQLSEEARDAYRKTGLPHELLTLPAVRMKEYAERCGVKLT